MRSSGKRSNEYWGREERRENRIKKIVIYAGVVGRGVNIEWGREKSHEIKEKIAMYKTVVGRGEKWREKNKKKWKHSLKGTMNESGVRKGEIFNNIFSLYLMFP